MGEEGGETKAKRAIVPRSAMTIEKKRNDPGRLTWEEYKKVYEADLDFTGKKQMHEYRAELDADRQRAFDERAKMKKKAAKAAAKEKAKEKKREKAAAKARSAKRKL